MASILDHLVRAPFIVYPNAQYLSVRDERLTPQVQSAGL